MKHARLTLGLTALSTLLLASGCANTRTITVPVPVEVLRYQYVLVPESLLAQHCATLRLSDAETPAEFEAKALEAWTCAMDSNRDKAAIRALSGSPAKQPSE